MYSAVVSLRSYDTAPRRFIRGLDRYGESNGPLLDCRLLERAYGFAGDGQGSVASLPLLSSRVDEDSVGAGGSLAVDCPVIFSTFIMYCSCFYLRSLCALLQSI